MRNLLQHYTSLFTVKNEFTEPKSNVSFLILREYKDSQKISEYRINSFYSSFPFCYEISMGKDLVNNVWDAQRITEYTDTNIQIKMI